MRWNHGPLCAAFFGISCLWSGLGRADAEAALAAGYASGEMPNARALALGGASYVLGGSTAATLYNPANLGMLKAYHMDAVAGFAPVAGRQSYGAMIADNSSTRTAMGLAGTWNRMEKDGLRQTWWDARIGAAYPLGERAYVGLSGRYLSITQLDTRVAGVERETASDGFAGGAGVAFALGDSMRLGLSGENLIGASDALLPRRFAGGLGLKVDELSVEASALVDTTSAPDPSWGARAGMEWLQGEHVPLRAGYSYDSLRGVHAGAAGLGYVGIKFGFDASVRHEFSGSTPGTSFVVALRYFLDVAGGSAAEEAADGGDGL